MIFGEKKCKNNSICCFHFMTYMKNVYNRMNSNGNVNVLIYSI